MPTADERRPGSLLAAGPARGYTGGRRSERASGRAGMSATAESSPATAEKAEKPARPDWFARLNRALVERPRLRRRMDGLLIALYLAIWSSRGLVPFNTTDLEAFFFPAARIALEGHPLGAYAVRFGEV